jgi:hypothetical protein
VKLCNRCNQLIPYVTVKICSLNANNFALVGFTSPKLALIG